MNLMEVKNMNVGKLIRILGYIVYTALWLPVILLTVIAAPLMVLAVDVRVGRPIGGSIEGIVGMFKESIQHDVEFIRNGTW
jgi:hypothetical protein